MALTVPDELTVSHSWKDEKKPREYSFDGVFGPEAGQGQVGVGPAMVFDSTAMFRLRYGMEGAAGMASWRMRTYWDFFKTSALGARPLGSDCLNVW